MRRDIQQVLERWGRWAASDEYCSLVDWPALSVIPGYKPASGKPVCSDEDGLVIDTCIAHMSMVRPVEDILILGQRFIGGHTTRFIAEAMDMPRFNITSSLRASEEFLSGCLVAMAVRLDMDPEISLPKMLADGQKHVLIF
ncbi:antitermination protein Q [Budviciaceae bacterium BWR-B9]|uniref:Antitermination protein Q n=1 Tax=Limnobaculum allomyrinae TaxID=2791986 RepID=A0ABS1IVS7_9GAMM|nr:MULTISPECIES: antiterminator Q family protein [Limnobaculum]MBK5145860.1 antitermination protein Q [Limnobaculum allomyrinae]MBV7693870.1 antitermination protein Q [Limnobaculum sp. M2-1]